MDYGKGRADDIFLIMTPNEITGANAGGPRPQTIRARWAARIASVLPLDEQHQTMKLVRPFDFVFLTSLGILAGSLIIVEATGGVGPCGPSSSWGIIWLIGYPVGALGMVVGLVLSLVSAFRKPRPKGTPNSEPK